jgi:chaperonin cofactor prefoldin
MDDKEKCKPDNTLLYMDLNRNFSILMERLRQLEIRINLLEKQMKELQNGK